MNRRKKSEIAELMAVRSKISENGEFQPEWKPPVCLSFIGLFCMEIFGSSTQEFFFRQSRLLKSLLLLFLHQKSRK